MEVAVIAQTALIIYAVPMILSLIDICSKPPQFSKCNISGYKTSLSLKNKSNWDYANKIAPKIIATHILIGQVVLQLILLFIHSEFNTFVHLFVFDILFLVVNYLFAVYKIEVKLKKFDADNS
jgi:hypothetical protein